MKILRFGLVFFCVLQNFDEMTATAGELDDDSSLMNLFKMYTKEYNRVYPNEKEFAKRLNAFRENLKTVKSLRENDLGTANYGLDKFSDWTQEELKTLKGFRPMNLNETLQTVEVPNYKIPKEFDWRDHGAVTNVKNQNFCEADWAFSAVGNIEGQWAINKKDLVSLSAQQVIDCDFDSNGCHGGRVTQAFDAIKGVGGLETEEDYKYVQRRQPCRFKKSKIRAKITGHVTLPTCEKAIAKWLYKNGPVSAALNSAAMMGYKGGVSHPKPEECSPDKLDHWVLIVGYGVDRSNGCTPYWIIKNSWGENWGDKGYYKLYRGDGSCGINLKVSSSYI